MMPFNALSHWQKINKLFLATVVVPTLLAIFYYGFIASDIYISESKFVVRSPEKQASGGLDLLLKSAGFANANEEIYAAQAFVTSRDALRDLNKNGAFARVYTDNVSFVDRFNATGWSGSFEHLYKYYRNKISVEHDAGSSISTLTVKAYTPADAQRFNEQLLEMAEATVNRLNNRGRQDLITFASREVNDAKVRATEAALALSAYRNSQGIVDPEKQAMFQLQMLSKLQDELLTNRSQLDQLTTFTPQNPQIEVMRRRIARLEQDIREQSGMVAGGRKSLAAQAAQYQRLLLESQIADKQVAGALASLDEARNEARRKQAYVERIEQPNLPDAPLEPKRLRGILAVFIASIVAYGILKMLFASLLEHRD